MVFTVGYFIIVSLALLSVLIIFKNKRLEGLVIASILVLGYLCPKALVITLSSSILTYFVLKTKKKNYRIGLIVLLLIVFVFSKTIFVESSFFIGYSYYFLQLLSLLIFPPKEEVKLLEVVAGTTFFTRFFAGPILSKNKLAILNKVSKEDIYYGINRITLGVFKKVVLSNRLMDMQSGYFDYPLETQNGLLALFSSFLFTAQMYLDFSAYSDIAIGTGRLLGVKLPENFNIPLRSKSVSEYWRKTHITLINWLTQHIYYPITYKYRKHKYIGVIVAILCTFILSGVWHGLTFGFIVWGVLNATYLVVEFLGNKRLSNWGVFGFTKVFFVLFVITIANFFFKINDFELIKQSINRLYEIPFLPIDYMTDFVAVLGKGGYLEQQFHLIENLVLLTTFFVLERKLICWSEKTKFSIVYFVILVLGIFIFGNFASTNEFIYLQF